jgi:hypothetical protein
MRYSKGIMWLDDCRIPFVDDGENTIRNTYDTSVETYGWIHHKGQMGSFDNSAKQGRFTPNLLVCDDMLNDGSNTQYGKKVNYNNSTFKEGLYGFECKAEAPFMYGDKGTNSRYYDLDKWFDKIIDEIQ